MAEEADTGAADLKFLHRRELRKRGTGSKAYREPPMPADATIRCG
jgi:hypothetical protein